MTIANKVLISTIRPAGGGVPAMVKAAIDYLHQRNYAVTLAYYEPYSVSPECSVPLHRLFQQRPLSKESEYYDCRCVGIGSYLPELEFTHYAASQAWRELICEHDIHLTVSGSCMAALPFVQTSTPFIAWIASDWQGDREHRVKSFRWYRRCIDQTIVRFISKRLEKKIIATERLLALSEHTKAVLNHIAGRVAVNDVLAMPINTDRFRPHGVSNKPYRIGFIGRFEDPRKNIRLLIRSFAKALVASPELELLLIGDTLSGRNRDLAIKLEVLSKIVTHQYLTGDKLLTELSSMHVFVLPSHQEGLCIAALEAMSCEIPVISTRCGGPEMFIEDQVNGLLVDSNPDAMANAISQLLTDDDRRLRYAKNARKTIVQHFSEKETATRFWRAFDRVFEPPVIGSGE